LVHRIKNGGRDFSLRKRSTFGSSNCGTTALLQANAKPNIQDKQGTTALMIAAAYGNGLIVEALQKAGADPSQTNNKGQTAYSIAREQHTAAIDYLKPPTQENREPAR
jgi:Ankyrin repeats (many copies)